MMSLYRSQIGANIRNYIELNKGLELMGLGYLTLVSKRPSLNLDQHFLFAGEEELVLNETQNELPSGFIDFLASKLDLSLIDAESIYRKFIAELVFEIETKGRAVIPQLGKFSRGRNGYHFEQNTTHFKDNYYGLPSLQLEPLEPAEAPKEVKPLAKKSKVEKVKSKDYGFLLKVAAVASLLILLASLYDLSTAQEPGQEMTQIELENSRYNQDPTKVLVSEKLTERLFPQVESIEQEVPSCALIVGSFARESNALELQQKVLDAGYEVYTEEFHEFYRVGVAFDCSDVRGATFKEIELALGIDPWLHIVR